MCRQSEGLLLIIASIINHHHQHCHQSSSSALSSSSSSPLSSIIRILCETLWKGIEIFKIAISVWTWEDSLSGRYKYKYRYKQKYITTNKNTNTNTRKKHKDNKWEFKMWEAISVSGWEHSLSGEYLVNSLLFQSTTIISHNFLSFFLHLLPCFFVWDILGLIF